MKKLLLLISAFLCCTIAYACTENSENTVSESSYIYEDMSIAETPEEMVARLTEAVAGFDEQAYIKCFPDYYYRNAYDEVIQSFYMHCRSCGMDYEVKRTISDFNVYMYEDNRNEEGTVSAISFLKGSDVIKLQINMQYDITRNGYYITDVFPSSPDKIGTNEKTIIEQGGKLVNYTGGKNEFKNG